MSDAGLVALVLRTALSLTVVLGVIGAAFLVVRRRATGGDARRRRRAATPAIEVVGRAGLARNASAVALRFGDRVVIVGVSEQAPVAVLGDVDADRWEELHPVEERRVPTPFGSDGAPTGGHPPSARPSLLDALRDATSRRA